MNLRLFLPEDLVRKREVFIEGLSEFFDVLRRVHPKEFVELRTEIFAVIDSHFHAYLVDVAIGCNEELCSFSQPDKANKGIDRLAGNGLYPFVKR